MCGSVVYGVGPRSGTRTVTWTSHADESEVKGSLTSQGSGEKRDSEGDRCTNVDQRETECSVLLRPVGGYFRTVFRDVPEGTFSLVPCRPLRDRDPLKVCPRSSTRPPKSPNSEISFFIV